MKKIIKYESIGGIMHSNKKECMEREELLNKIENIYVKIFQDKYGDKEDDIKYYYEVSLEMDKFCEFMEMYSELIYENYQNLIKKFNKNPGDPCIGKYLSIENSPVVACYYFFIYTDDSFKMWRLLRKQIKKGLLK